MTCVLNTNCTVSVLVRHSVALYINVLMVSDAWHVLVSYYPA